MKTIARMLSVTVVVLLAACGGGGADQGAEAPTAQSGSATIDAAGGTVEARLAGGAQITLALPASALEQPTVLTIEPIAAPAGQLAAFTVKPAGLRLARPATLTLRLPGDGAVDPDTTLLLDTGARQVPLGRPVDASTRTITVELSSLGAPSVPVAPAGTRARALASSFTPDAMIILLGRSNLAGRINLLDLVTGDLASDGSVENATNVQLAMASLLGIAAADADSRVRSDLFTWRRVVCGQQAFAISALGSFGGSDVATFSQRAFDVLSWDRFAQDLNELVARVTPPAEAGCPGVPADFAQPVRDHLPAFLAAVTGALNLLDARADFTQLLTARIPELLKLESVLQGTDMTASVLPLIGEQTSRLRAAAYDACRNERDQSLQRTLLVKEIGDALFGTASPFDEGALQQDIQFCGMALRFKVLDAGGLALQQGDVGGLAVGSVKTAVTLRLAGAAKIVLSGPLAALICPSGSQNAEQLAFDAGPLKGPLANVGRITPSAANGYLESGTLDLDVATLLAAGAETLTVGRTGGLCSGNFPNLIAHSTIATFALDTQSLQIVTASLPDAVSGTFYSGTLVATGGVAPLTWSVSGLPAGLTLDSATGVVSGVPAATGSVTITVQVTDATGSSDSDTASITVGATVLDGTWSFSDTDTTTGRNLQSFGPVHSRGNQIALGGFVFEVASGGAMIGVGIATRAGDLDSVAPLSEFTFSNIVGTLFGAAARFSYDNDDQSFGTGIHHHEVNARRFGP